MQSFKDTCSTVWYLRQRTATHCITLQHTVTHYNTLQHTATHCNTLQHTVNWYLRLVEAWSTTHTCMYTYICVCVWFYTFWFYTFDLCVIRSGRHTIDTLSSKHKSSLNHSQFALRYSPTIFASSRNFPLTLTTPVHTTDLHSIFP